MVSSFDPDRLGDRAGVQHRAIPARVPRLSARADSQRLRDRDRRRRLHRRLPGRDRALRRRASRIIRAFTKPNGGLSDARNFGMDRAEGEYFAFVDGDDLVAPTMLARMHERALATGADLVVCGMENFADGEASGIHYAEPDLSVFGHSLAQEPRLLYRVDASACDKLYSRELFMSFGRAVPGRSPVRGRADHLPAASLCDQGREDRRTALSLPPRPPASISGRYDERYLDLIQGFRLIDEAYLEAGDPRGEPRCSSTTPPHASGGRPLSRPIPACHVRGETPLHLRSLCPAGRQVSRLARRGGLSRPLGQSCSPLR